MLASRAGFRYCGKIRTATRKLSIANVLLVNLLCSTIFYLPQSCLASMTGASPADARADATALAPVAAPAAVPADAHNAETQSSTIILGAPILLSKSQDPSQSSERPSRPFLAPAILPPEEPENHSADNKMELQPLRQFALPRIASMTPVRLEASYNERLTLKDALSLTLQSNLPIKIAASNCKYQKYQFYARLAGFLPSFSTGWGYDHASVQPIPTAANSRVFLTSLNWPIFRGGAVAYSALSQYYTLKAYEQLYRINVNDKLLDTYNLYNSLVLNYALLQVRSKAFQIAKMQLELNNSLFRAGSGTKYDIMQSRAELARDELALLKQEQVTRQASLALSYVLDLPMAINFVPVDKDLAEGDLINTKIEIKEFLRTSQQHRPEIKQFEDFRLVANRNIQAAASSLYPTISLFATFTNASATVYPAGNTDQLAGVASTGLGSFNVGTVSNTALNQTASFTPTSSNSGTNGASSSASVVASSGGNPLANTQSSGLVTSGAVAPSFAGYTGSGFSSSGAGIFPGLTNTFRIGLSLSWYVSSLYQTNVASIMQQKQLAREALIQSNQELLTVSAQVRTAYCNKISSRAQIDSAAFQVKSGEEALRQGTIRFRASQATTIELLQAKRRYIDALNSWAQAIAASNQAQAQLLHDIGLISINSLLNGYFVGGTKSFP